MLMNHRLKIWKLEVPKKIQKCGYNLAGFYIFEKNTCRTEESKI